MNQQLLKFLFLPVIIVLAIWLWWPSSSSVTHENQTQNGNRQTLVSAIQPVNEADALTAETRLPEKQTRARRWQPDTQDQKDFDSATVAIQNGELESATVLLKELIIRKPGMLEPYINLASTQVASGDLNSARQTLMLGLNANENYGALFENLQKVHAALAADAYQQALSDKNSKTQNQTKRRLRLPIVTALNESVSPADDTVITAAQSQILRLQNALQQRGEKLNAVSSQLATREQDIAALQEQLKVVESSVPENDRASSSATTAITTLEAKLSEAQQKIASIVSGHASELSNLRTKLKKQQAMLDEQALLAADAESELAASLPDEKLAIEHVKSWATAWSNQDVDDYVSHYQENYVPQGSSITHETWLEQRQIRLTNKRFIEITLSSFDAEVKDDSMVVKFLQRYRSNTMDDTIRKEITLQPRNDDWAEPRIVTERVLK